jgi:hypothetical protein
MMLWPQRNNTDNGILIDHYGKTRYIPDFIMPTSYNGEDAYGVIGIKLNTDDDRDEL